jgi:GH15 family glucan-1,4-alpha-glucosidase
MVVRAMLSMRALTLPNGAVAAAWHPHWDYTWPRDASFVCAAYAATGHHDDAYRVLSYLDRIRPARGPWQARYLLDGSGDVPDDRGTQRDGGGWVAWSTWLTTTTDPDATRARRRTQRLWRMVVQAAETLSASLHPATGLPRRSADYWERPESEVTLGIAAPSLLGLRAAAALACRVGEHRRAERWMRSARQLDAAIADSFGVKGYPRVRSSAGMDTAVTFLAPPFAPARDDVRAAVARANERLRLRNGGVSPGEDWKDDHIAWTPETALFALASANSGDRSVAAGHLEWLDAHRTGLGALPEKVLDDGSPAAVAPLAWTAAVTVLTTRSLDRALPIPPV